MGDKDKGLGVAVWSGNQGSFTFSGAESLVVANFMHWKAQVKRYGSMVRPFGYSYGRFLHGPLVPVGVIVGYVDDLPPIPSAQTGTLVLKLTASESYTFKASLVSLDIGTDAVANDRQVQAYSFMPSAESVADEVVTT